MELMVNKARELANAISAQATQDQAEQRQKQVENDKKAYEKLPQVMKNTLCMFTATAQDDDNDMDVRQPTAAFSTMIETKGGDPTVQRILHHEAKRRGLRLYTQIGL